MVMRSQRQRRGRERSRRGAQRGGQRERARAPEGGGGGGRGGGGGGEPIRCREVDARQGVEDRCTDEVGTATIGVVIGSTRADGVKRGVLRLPTARAEAVTETGALPEGEVRKRVTAKSAPATRTRTAAPTTSAARRTARVGRCRRRRRAVAWGDEGGGRSGCMVSCKSTIRDGTGLAGRDVGEGREEVDGVE